MVPPDSGRIPPVPPYSGYSPLNIPFSHTGLSPSAVVLSRTLPLRYVHDLGVLQPRKRLDVPGLGSSAFARHYSRNHYCFLFLRLLRCFSSAGSPPFKGCQAFNLTGCPIRKSGYQHLFAVTPGLSQLVTSFFASRSPGIPRAPLVTLSTIDDITFTCSRSSVFIAFLVLLDSCQSLDLNLLVSSSIMSMNPCLTARGE